MNCQHVQELLPLWIGSDLKEERARLVATHLQSCAECAGAADEYRETRQLLQQFAPPPFSEAVYDGVRRRVLHEIEQEAPAPGLSRLSESLFRPRLRWAAATALLLAISVFAFYFIANRRNHPQQVAGAVDRTNKDEPPNATPQSGTDRNTGAHKTIAGSGERPHQPQRRRISGTAADRATSVAVNTANSPSTNSGVVPELNNLAQPDVVPGRDRAASEKTLRMEMQTKDPNIRIIWFFPQRTKQDSPGKFSKGI